MRLANYVPQKVKRFLKPIVLKLKNFIRQAIQRIFRDYSQGGETRAVRNALKNYPNHSFVEIGANDGITYSTTYGLLLDGWRGWSIEANPVTYKSLLNNLRKFDEVKVFNLAIAPKKGKIKLWLGNNDPLGLLATISQEESDWFSAHRSSKYIEVDGVPLSLFLTQLNVPTHFGLLLVDTEGMDLEILRTLDPNIHKPKLIITEDYEPKNSEKFSLLESYGYKFLERVGCNTFWIKEE